jgi:nucleoside-diphosphate-sugar epimerase
MRYVVTGAAGFIGSHLTEALLERGDDVVAIDSFTPYYDVARKEENAAAFEVHRVDLAADELDFDGVDGVFHLAGQPGVRSFGVVFGEYVRQNMLASQRVFEAAAAARTRVVFASSSSVYGDAETYPTPEDTQPLPISPYGITKLGVEHLARAYAQSFDLDVVGLRYFTVYGPRQRPDMAIERIVEALAAGGTYEVYGDGSQSRSFTYVGDAVAATIAAMGGGDGIYNVGGGDESPMLDVIAKLERISGRKLDVVRTAATAGDVHRTRADTRRIETDLGWSPVVRLEDGLTAQWQWASARVGAR